jgi:penicillin-binding protein 1A
MQIEEDFSKEEILAAYCNQIPFGVRAVGVERAARQFFGIPAADLDLAQSALLAGLPNSPSRFNPYVHPEAARQRQLRILYLMTRNGIISEFERTKAEAETLTFKSIDYLDRGGWFADKVLEECENRFGRDAIYYGGLKIYTTLEPAMQSAAENAVQKGMELLVDIIGSDSLQVALVASSPFNGAITALVGGRDYQTSQFDRATNACRRPGSGFKPFLYYTAMNNLGYNPSIVFLDSAITIDIPGQKPWSPENFEEQYFGRVILKFALAKSLNSVAVRLVLDTGAEAVVQTAHQFGIKSVLTPALSIALGTSGVTPLEIASAFSVIASGGQYFEPFCIERVETPWGEPLYEHFISGRQVARPELIYLLLDMMKEVLDGGTAISARNAGFRLPAGGKTGTTDDFCDSWFTGFTPALCASVWIGFDREFPMINKNGHGISGAQGALPVWVEFMKTVTEGEPTRDFTIPPGIKFITVNPFTGCPADSGTIMKVAILEGTQLTSLTDSLTDQVSP